MWQTVELENEARAAAPPRVLRTPFGAAFTLIVEKPDPCQRPALARGRSQSHVGGDIVARAVLVLAYLFIHSLSHSEYPPSTPQNLRNPIANKI